jgi:hypothetical protein
MVHGAETVQDLTEDNVVVMNGGSLTVTGTLSVHNAHGDGAQRADAGAHRRRSFFRDAPINTAYDPEQFGHGLIVMGTLRGLGFAKTVRARLNDGTERGCNNPATRATGHRLAGGRRPRARATHEAPWWDDIDWAPNGVPDGAARPRATTDQTELPRVASVSGDGKTVALQAPLLYTHPGARDHNGAITSGNPVVPNQTRSIVVRSEKPHRCSRAYDVLGIGPISIWNTSSSTILGRTCAEQLDNTTWTNNVPTHIGACQNGRYALHSHHLNGPVNSSLGHRRSSWASP